MANIPIDISAGGRAGESNDVGAQEYFAAQPSPFYRFYGPMPAASFGRKES